MCIRDSQSIDSASEDQDLDASLDRSSVWPMRLNLQPQEIIKLAVHMVGGNNFLMRELGNGNTELQPLEMNKVFPEAQGLETLPSTYRRYALYYQTHPSVPKVLISPLSLELIGYTAALTRIVTDPKVFQRFPGEFEKIRPQSHYFQNPLARLKLYMGLENTNDSVRADLMKFSRLAHEGEMGISSRAIQEWIKTALDIAKAKGLGVLTPEIVDTAFRTLMDGETLKPKSDDCLLYTSPSPRDRTRSRMPSSA